MIESLLDYSSTLKRSGFERHMIELECFAEGDRCQPVALAVMNLGY